MIVGVHFMCGCDMEKREDVLANPGTFDTVKIDEEGYPICTIHHARPYGWRDPGYIKIRDGDGESFRVFDQVQARAEANVPPITYPPLVVHLNRSVKPLDNSDPQEVGAKILERAEARKTRASKEADPKPKSGNKGKSRPKGPTKK